MDKVITHGGKRGKEGTGRGYCKTVGKKQGVSNRGGGGGGVVSVVT